MCREFYSLCFTAAQCSRGLTESQVTKANGLQRFQSRHKFACILEEKDRLTNCHLQDIVNVPAFVFNFENFGFKSCSLAILAGQFDICQELHFQGDGTASLTGLAASARNVERKMRGI